MIDSMADISFTNLNSGQKVENLVDSKNSKIGLGSPLPFIS